MGPFLKRWTIPIIGALTPAALIVVNIAVFIVKNLPEEPKSFEDYVDDDGRGNGPFKMKLTVWREGEHAYFDWTGTSQQAPGPINFYLHEGMFKMFIGVYMIMVFDPQIDRKSVV